jgi:hypothetical protein
MIMSDTHHILQSDTHHILHVSDMIMSDTHHILHHREHILHIEANGDCHDCMYELGLGGGGRFIDR